MIDFKLQDGDLAFDNADLAMTEGSNELAQSAYIGLQTRQGEWFLNESIGLDYAVILAKQPDSEAIRAEVTREMLQNDRIQTVDEVTSVATPAARSLSISFKATGTDGETATNEVNVGGA